MPRWLLIATAVVTLFAACGGDETDPEDCGLSATCTPPATSGQAATQNSSSQTAPADVDCDRTVPGDVPTISFNPGTPRATQLNVEIADEPSERGQGLSDRECLPLDWGMLFVFEADSTATFGMSRTLIPLSIAWVKEDGTIVEIEDMEPLTSTSHGASEPYRYAIEVNQGFFDGHGIEAGDRVDVEAAIAD